MATVIPVPAAKSSIVADLENANTVRNDLAFAIAVVGIAVAFVAPSWHMPVILDATLGAVSALLALGVRIAATIAHNGFSKAAVLHDADALLGDLPVLKSVVAGLAPQIPALQAGLTEAAAESVKVKGALAQVQAQVAGLPQDQASIVSAVLTHLSAIVSTVISADTGTPAAPAAPAAPVDPAAAVLQAS